ncbi:type II toxin-antitoxin system HipA family toxin YjjJ [Acidovorax sp. NCPPB 3576]|uniref:type II toxin-antitoxin system HipA family toxin YjjJ n=1 Tax=Acidovorax sp. NCPPB 3576 TaxID=2940488 RepID=UPI00234B83D8|nr:type II toxin-antitoxin system HipA family toxin YjjJ [Acidovorax sp. NCPPB 3576]WCM87404.1 type II toxin-antitoxin system HipA family toxin YjjJ [Acidovorax sp. NCPPB 3576]
MESLGARQPTVSRALKLLGDEVVQIGAARSIQYALRDAARAQLQAPVYRVSAEGQLQALGTLIPVAPEGFVMVQADGKRVHSDGLPWWIFDMRPQGYLGRAYNQRHGARLGLPERLSDWGDTHVLRALLLQGDDLPGNLLLGAAAREQFVNAPAPLPIPTARRPQAYVDLAAAATRGELQGSSAAGEQPKFTAYVQPETGPAVHTIVKFSASLPTLVSERWRDLLLAEHIALQVLGDAGIPASLTRVIDHGTQRFLEVQRFDRVGGLGRRALHTLAALDAEFVGHGGRWPEIAQALARERIIVPEALEGACLLWAFGTLIGNTDMHSGNLSFMSEQGRPYQLAPAYDMTPMAFAPTAGGDLPQRKLELNVGQQVSARAWLQALPLAQDFVQRLRGAEGFSGGFGPCLAALQMHVALAAERIGRLVP